MGCESENLFPMYPFATIYEANDFRDSKSTAEAKPGIHRQGPRLTLGSGLGNLTSEIMLLLKAFICFIHFASDKLSVEINGFIIKRRKTCQLPSDFFN